MPDRKYKAIAAAAKSLAREKREHLEELKTRYSQIARKDFIWHYLLQSFATMGRAAGWNGLIGNKENYNKLRYETLLLLGPRARKKQVEAVCRNAKIRMPNRKAHYIMECFKQIHDLGGPLAAKKNLLNQPGRDAKIRFLKLFAGIGDKYSRNIMMDVYHEDFRDSIAIDARIKTLSKTWGLSFNSYSEHEDFYLSVAAKAKINGWELDRLMFNFQNEFLKRVSNTIK